MAVGKSSSSVKLRPLVSLARIVVKFHDDIVKVKQKDKKTVDSFLKKNLLPWQQLIKLFPGISIMKLIRSVKPERIDELIRKASRLNNFYQPYNFNSYFVIECPIGVDANALLNTLSHFGSVELAYIESPIVPPPAINPGDDPLTEFQGYLNAAPAGINARYAWTVNGGDGTGTIKFIDIEQGWILNHQDLSGVNLIYGDNDRYFDHGAAVLGIILMRDNVLIGGVGITPSIINAYVISQIPNGIADAIWAAIDNLGFGDILLLEAQVSDAAGKFWPVEIEDANFKAIQLATALGIMVIEAAGNGDRSQFPVGNDIDTKLSGADSGAIIVGAASDTIPHRKVTSSNFGNRVNCYAWGSNVATAGFIPSRAIDAYTHTFCCTSSASAIIAGAAISVQSMTEAGYQFRYTPAQLRDILSNVANGTPSADPLIGKIGVMPDLQRIATNALGLTSDIYIRDNIGDDGDPQSGLLSRSPDIIVLQNRVAGNPQIVFGEGSGTENDDQLSETVISGQDQFIYLRIKNRGQLDDANVTARVYWAEPSTLLTPDQWHFISNVNFPNPPAVSIDFPNVPVGFLTVSNTLTWLAADIPVSGHYCFIAIVESLSDPMPLITDINDLPEWENFIQLIGNSNNIAWRNFDIVPMAPPPGEAFIEMKFMSPGAPKLAVKMSLEVGAHLPSKSQVYLAIPLLFLNLLPSRTPYIKIDKEEQLAYLPLKYNGKHAVGEVLYPAGARFKMKLLAKIPEEFRNRNYEIFVRQLYKQKEVGRVTWRLLPEEKKLRKKKQQE